MTLSLPEGLHITKAFQSETDEVYKIDTCWISFAPVFSLIYC